MKSRRGSHRREAAQNPAGSPQPGEPVFLVVGKLRRTHGVRGEIQMELITDAPERLKPGQEFFYGEEYQPVKLASIRPHNQLVLVSFEGIETREDAARLTNKLLSVRRESLPDLPEGSYYHFQLVGLKVLTAEGEELGQLSEILNTGANDVYVVKPTEGKEILIPALEDTILSVNLEKGEMRVQPPEWLDG